MPTLALTLAFLALAACGGENEDVCREPELSAYGEDDERHCSIRWDRCESGGSYWVSCSNYTFSGDYECECFGTLSIWEPMAQPFDSPDICDQSLFWASSQAREGCGWRIVEE